MRLLWIGLLVACGGTSSSECGRLDTDACAADASCDVIEGGYTSVLDTGGGCLSVGAPQPFGCQAIDVGCDDVLTYAAPTTDDQCVQFPDSCIPAGWVPCDPGADNLCG